MTAPASRDLRYRLLACAFSLAAVLSPAAVAQVAATAVGAPVAAAHKLLAGITVNGRSPASGIDLLDLGHGRYRANLDQFAAAIQTRVIAQGDAVVLPTPLGNARIPGSAILSLDGARFVPVRTLAHALAGRIAFDQGEFALEVTLPWSPGATPDTGEGSSGITAPSETPDIRAPVASLSTIHSEAYLTRQGGIDSLATLTDLGGALGPGAWRTRILTSSPGGRQSMQDYGWLLDRGRSRLYLGHSQLALDPLLPYANLTGMQYAWSNRPDLSYGDTLANNQLVATQTLGGQSLSGRDAPPGGIAELRVDGKVVARTAIRLDGSWAFRNVTLRGTEFAQVALYERFGDGTPTRVVNVNAATSPRALPAGTLVSYAGLGADGNPLDPAIRTHGLGGFYQVRWGVSDRLTLDASAQHAGGRDYGATNAIMGLGALGTWGVGIARSGGAAAWSVQGDGQRGMWFWNGYARRYGSNYFPGVAAVQSDRYGELGARISPRLNVSLVGRDATDPFSAHRYVFVRPAVDWSVTDRFSVGARPDYNGQYTYAASWDVRNDIRLMLSRYVGISQLELTHALDDGLQVDLSVTRDPQRGTRFAQTLSGLWTGGHPFSWTASLLEGSSRIGYLLDAATEAIPGLSMHVQVYNDPTRGPSGIGSGTTLQLSLVADFAVTPSGLARGAFSATVARRGGISGKVTGDLPEGVHWSDLAGVRVLVDGRPVGQLDARGHYLVSDLAPGVYRLQMDTEKLPIDLQPPSKQPLVEVRAGATTRADFAMQLRVGMAGRLTDGAGKPLAGAVVRVLDASGQLVTSVYSNALGYFRVDQLAPGDYTLQSGTARRRVRLDRRFVYGQDLTL
ncbi:MAG: carboxypeptidase regulatory-like domain-containing protein [Xanthomonadaceae bacterium]|nr:carboxypeptidase regulatory-like domain-containing protein [Xanthomonadaceae bacterium]MDE1963991.1 carboxypeptidase regulatory-like domain-containing protein [Xanthomonadaceae bacterium]